MSARLLSWCKIYLLDDGDGQGGVKTVVAVRQVERVADEHLRIGTTKSVNGTIRSSRKKRVERINGGVPSTLPFDDFPQWKLAPTSENHRSTLPNLSKDRLEKVYNTWRPIHHSIGQCSGAAAFFFPRKPSDAKFRLVWTWLRPECIALWLVTSGRAQREGIDRGTTRSSSLRSIHQSLVDSLLVRHRHVPFNCALHVYRRCLYLVILATGNFDGGGAAIRAQFEDGWVDLEVFAVAAACTTTKTKTAKGKCKLYTRDEMM